MMSWCELDSLNYHWLAFLLRSSIAAFTCFHETYFVICNLCAFFVVQCVYELFYFVVNIYHFSFLTYITFS